MLWGKNMFKKINRLGFHGWIGNVIRFKKSRILPFCMHTDWSFTLWWQNVRFEGYWREALARRETQERHTGMESKGESRRISFHVWLACTYCFPAGRFAWALGRQGVFCFSSFFLFLLLHITHTHGSHTPGAQTLPKAGGIRECICIF